MYLHAASLAGLALTVLAFSSLGAQSQSADATVSAEVVGPAAPFVVNTGHLDFGDQATGAVVFSTDVPTAASWNVTLNAAGSYAFSFTLPTQLTNSFGPVVPITFGSTSASSPAMPAGWNPAVPVELSDVTAGFILDIFLGAVATGGPSDDVSVDLAGAAPGYYTALVTLTVAVQ